MLFNLPNGGRINFHGIITLDLNDLLAAGVISVQQIYSDVYADPNAAGLVPADASIGALYYQDPGVIGGSINVWLWSEGEAEWYQAIAP